MGLIAGYPDPSRLSISKQMTENSSLRKSEAGDRSRPTSRGSIISDVDTMKSSLSVNDLADGGSPQHRRVPSRDSNASNESKDGMREKTNPESCISFSQQASDAQTMRIAQLPQNQSVVYASVMQSSKVDGSVSGSSNTDAGSNLSVCIASDNNSNSILKTVMSDENNLASNRNTISVGRLSRLDSLDKSPECNLIIDESVPSTDMLSESPQQVTADGASPVASKTVDDSFGS